MPEWPKGADSKSAEGVLSPLRGFKSLLLRQGRKAPPRRTEDMDIFLSPDEDNLKRTKTCLKELTGDPELESLEPKDFREYAVIRYGTPDGFYIDLGTALGERLS